MLGHEAGCFFSICLKKQTIKLRINKPYFSSFILAVFNKHIASKKEGAARSVHGTVGQLRSRTEICCWERVN